MGRASVAAFALLSGYVNSLGPMKRARSGNLEGSLSGIAKSAFRRTGRFVIPAMIATTLSWLACQFGAYKIAKVAGSNWIRDTSPEPSISFATAFYDLFDSLGRTWLDGANPYDKIQWTLTFLLKGSMETYLTLVATVYVKPRWRMLILCGLFYFKWKSGDGERQSRVSVLSLFLADNISGRWFQYLLWYAPCRHLPRCRSDRRHRDVPLHSKLLLCLRDDNWAILLFIPRGKPIMEYVVGRVGKAG